MTSVDLRTAALVPCLCCVVVWMLGGPLANRACADGAPVFHLDFSAFGDISGNDLAIDVGDAVSLLPAGGPILGNGTTLNAGHWDGTDDEENEILILDNPILDEVSVSAGSIATWIRVEDDEEWNNILKTVCEDHAEPCDAFGEFSGIEFQASNHAGVFGAAQGWNTNVFGPNAPQNGGPGAETPSGVWTHAALTWNDDGDHTIFVNGEPGPTVDGVGVDPFGWNEPGGWTIGGDGLVPSGYPDATRRLWGDLADFAIFDGELSEDEIVQIMNSGVPSSAAPKLLAGDSDMDFDFDQLDLVLVQVAAKYLTGAAATWARAIGTGLPVATRAHRPPAMVFLTNWTSSRHWVRDTIWQVPMRQLTRTGSETMLRLRSSTIRALAKWRSMPRGYRPDVDQHRFGCGDFHRRCCPETLAAALTMTQTITFSRPPLAAALEHLALATWPNRVCRSLRPERPNRGGFAQRRWRPGSGGPYLCPRTNLGAAVGNGAGGDGFWCAASLSTQIVSARAERSWALSRGLHSDDLR